MPYSTIRGAFPDPGGAPVIELLRDGRNWRHPGAGCFRFGNRKCRMLLGCKSVLEGFRETNGENPEQHNQTVPPSPWLIHTPILVQGFPNFILTNNGAMVAHPYLKFSCNEAGEIGIGLTKTDGLLCVWEDLVTFANEVGMPPIGAPANIQDI